MGYTKGHVYDIKPDRVPEQVVWHIGMVGTVTESVFHVRWNNTSNQIRSVTHQPVIGTDESTNIFANVDLFCALLADLGKNNWDLEKQRVIIDPWTDEKINNNLDALIVYGQKFHEKLSPVHKPLLRFIPKRWSDFYAANAGQTLKLLNYFDLLMVQPEWLKPSKYQGLSGMVYPKWFEYNYGLIAYDPSGQWLENVTAPPVVVPEPEPEPEQPGEVVPPVVSKLPEGRFYLFGFLPIGKIRFE